MIQVRDIAWLAGLIEGEGSFYFNDTPTIDVAMTDEDVIKRAAAIVGVNPRKPWQSKLGNRKLVYGFVLCGTRAVSWMMTLYALMGERRQAKIAEILSRWRQMPDTPRAPRGQRFMATCHPDRVRAGRGLCHSCYMREWRAKRRLVAQEAT